MIFSLHTFDRKFCIKKNQPSFKAYSAIFKLKSAPAMFTSQYCPQLKVEHYHLKQILVPVTFQKLTLPTDTSLVLSLIVLGIKFEYHFVLMWILGYLAALDITQLKVTMAVAKLGSIYMEIILILSCHFAMVLPFYAQDIRT